MRHRVRHFVIGGALLLALCMAAAALSARPEWHSLSPGLAVLRLSFVHSGDTSTTCRTRSAEELAKLPPNMRAPKVCDRRRPPVYVELEVDGRIIFAKEAPPSGLSGSGPSRVYERFVLPAGPHRIAARMRDRPDTVGFDYQGATEVTLRPAQSFVVEFRREDAHFSFE